MDTDERLHTLWVLGAIAGAAAGAALVALLGIPIGYLVVKSHEAEVRRGYPLVPVTVASEDISSDSLVSMEQLSQRSMPESLASASIVLPDKASYIVNQRTLVPITAGDPFRWTMFWTHVDKNLNGEFEAVEACLAATKTAPDATPARIRSRLERGHAR